MGVEVLWEGYGSGLLDEYDEDFRPIKIKEGQMTQIENKFKFF